MTFFNVNRPPTPLEEGGRDVVKRPQRITQHILETGCEEGHKYYEYGGKRFKESSNYWEKTDNGFRWVTIYE